MKYKKIAVMLCIGVFSACSKPTQPTLSNPPIAITEKKLIIEDIKTTSYQGFGNAFGISTVIPSDKKGYLKIQVAGFVTTSTEGNVYQNVRVRRNAELTIEETDELLSALKTGVSNLTSWKPTADANSRQITYLTNGITFTIEKSKELSVSLGVNLDRAGVSVPEEELHKFIADLSAAKTRLKK